MGAEQITNRGEERKNRGDWGTAQIDMQECTSGVAKRKGVAFPESVPPEGTTLTPSLKWMVGHTYFRPRGAHDLEMTARAHLERVWLVAGLVGDMVATLWEPCSE